MTIEEIINKLGGPSNSERQKFASLTWVGKDYNKRDLLKDLECLLQTCDKKEAKTPT